ncbi:MAG: WecB/TagA/CpsF family glycosyltransferase [bacterium]|nr:WecB/TagA/CpsF family glycosyltransferase [bacterium]
MDAPPRAPRKPQDLAAIASRHILGMRVDGADYAGAIERIIALVREGRGGTVCVATVHMVMEAFDDPGLRAQINAADLVTSDGVPLVWSLRALGVAEAERVYGPTLTPKLCAAAEVHGLRVGFLGGTEAVLAELEARIQRDHPRLEIAFAYAPAFRPLSPEEDAALVSAIVDAGVDLLFVGLGCPKQERWMAAHRGALSCVCVGVGAAFDFIAGAKRQAPAVLQDAGLEWLFRLLTEPRRLWRRYLYHNPRYCWAFAVQWLRSLKPGPTGAGS